MKLSVNLNKIALIRNSRGSNNPSLIDYASQCIELGVDGLTLHPRPDHRHATSEDAINLSKLCKDHNIEFNLEGNPFSMPDGAFIGFQELCAQANPHQVTLVPDNLQQITSDHGWQPGFLDNELKGFIGSLKDSNARTSLFIDANAQAVEYADSIGFDRVEIYTGPFAKSLEERDQTNLALCKSNIIECINLAKQSMLGINAGHDLNLDNLPHLIECGSIDEVSIGHAIITDALKFGFEDTIMKYIKAVRNNY
ncbi:MAG: pyridoxine 5'-phosphate synthase [SAR86 cluster bacterium]|uniref:Pyridoxine 5'-phosphate synthase n=1 Tax=SAR86 cluster bacterium TaxID=2030880 RepID=A0A520LR90_9GAMM|nr:MAG: pyridoxine 5'-phosphate synthase [SAR86 cluster bacterium]